MNSPTATRMSLERRGSRSEEAVCVLAVSRTSMASMQSDAESVRGMMIMLPFAS